MAENIITPKFRAGFVGLFKATAPMSNPNGAKKYSMRAIFMPDTDLSALKEQAKIAAEEKWGQGKVPKTIRSPFRTNEELENPVPGIPDDAVVMTFSANEDRRPGVVDKNAQDIIDDSEVYAGAWFRAEVRAFAYDNAGNKGVSFGLQNVQKLKDDEPLGKGRAPAAKVFGAYAEPGEKTSAGSLFD